MGPPRNGAARACGGPVGLGGGVAVGGPAEPPTRGSLAGAGRQRPRAHHVVALEGGSPARGGGADGVLPPSPADRARASSDRRTREGGLLKGMSGEADVSASQAHATGARALVEARRGPGAVEAGRVVGKGTGARSAPRRGDDPLPSRREAGDGHGIMKQRGRGEGGGVKTILS